MPRNTAEELEDLEDLLAEVQVDLVRFRSLQDSVNRAVLGLNQARARLLALRVALEHAA